MDATANNLRTEVVSASVYCAKRDELFFVLFHPASLSARSVYARWKSSVLDKFRIKPGLVFANSVEHYLLFCHFADLKVLYPVTIIFWRAFAALLQPDCKHCFENSLLLLKFKFIVSTKCVTKVFNFFRKIWYYFFFKWIVLLLLFVISALTPYCKVALEKFSDSFLQNK